MLLNGTPPTPILTAGEAAIIRHAIAATEPVMDTSLSRLLHSATLLGSAPNPLASLLPAAGQPPRVIEARVMSVTLLLNAAGDVNSGSPKIPGETAATLPRYQVQLEIGGQLLRGTAALLAAATSMQLRQGQTVQLAVDSGGRMHLLNPALAQPAAALGLSGNAAISSSSATAPPAASVLFPAPAPAQAQAQAAPTEGSIGELAQLRHWARVLLPQQQPLHELVPVMQRWLTALSSGMPAVQTPELAAARQLAQRWLAQLATPDQLSDANTLRNALLESGTFTEGHWRQALTAVTPPPPPDQKSLLLQLLNLLQRPAQSRGTTGSPSGTEGRMPHGPLATGRHATGDAAGNAHAAPADARSEPGPASEALLRQLNAALARTHLHQVDSLANRQPAGNEAQPGNTGGWSFELPIRDGQHFSSLELHIQRREAGRKDPRQVRWHVDLRLDLHEYGRFSAQLNLLGQQVSATLWAEQAATHLRVRQHLAALRFSLEAVGVQVQRLDCRCGIPPSAQPAFRRQLVDVRT